MHINLGLLTKERVRNLCGPGQGFKARELLKLDAADIDEAAFPHIVSAPEDLLVISTRYVAELFGASVRRAETKSTFYRMYDFTGLNVDLREQIENGVESIIIRQPNRSNDDIRHSLTT